jgi:organic radical activating enzyme
MEHYLTRQQNTKAELDAVSPSMCIAKWKQVTIHLQNGHTHSCHHPGTHKVPLEEIKINVSALHNTNFKKEQRKLMLEGVRPHECGYCWKVEDNSNQYSDRIAKSSESWARPHLQDIVSKPWNDNVAPSYLEVSFSNVCNFKCSYCSPNISSQWMDEIQRYGHYPTTTQFNGLYHFQNAGQMPIPNNQENPYVEAFWQWWPEIYPTLEHFRITGGEPILSKDTFRVLEHIIANPNPNLTLSVNTNMNPPDQLYDRFLELVKQIVDNKLVKDFKIYTSAEAHGTNAEYIRNGMNYEAWLANMNKTLTALPSVQVIIMSTYNFLSMPTYRRFLEDVLDLKLRYLQPDPDKTPVMLSIPFLRNPTHQTAFILEPQHLHWIEESIEYMKANMEASRPRSMGHRGFYEHEVNQLVRIKEMLETELTKRVDSDKIRNRLDFCRFVDEHDRRRGTNFLETFPELAPAYHTWKQY